MNVRHRNGPGGLPVVDVQLDAERWNLADEGGFEQAAPELAREAGLEYFVEEHLDKPEAPKLILVLDEPNRTAPRAALAVALAAELIRWEKSVLVLDGDDHRPDLTRWADRLDAEGWVDVIRYGVSVEAASIPLPFAPRKGRLLGVGSYQPTRITAEELAGFVSGPGEAYDHIIVSASTGDRGSVWASQPAMSLVCWTPGVQHENVVEGMVRDAGLLGETPRAIMELAGRPAGEAPVSAEELAAFDGDGGHSSPVFRRLAGLLAVLIVVLAIWWFGVLKRGGDEPAIAANDGAATVAERTDAAPARLPGAAAEAAAEAGNEAEEPAGDVAGSREETAGAVADLASETADAVAGQAAAAADGLARQTARPAGNTAAAAADAPAPAARDEVPAADPAAFAADVGAAGWCLHLYSLRHQDVAEEMVRAMGSRGVQGRIAATRDDAGEYWYRVYAGSFADRAAANAAIPALLERLDADYAAPKRAADIF